MSHSQEPVLVQALVAELAVEGFDVGVLVGLAGADEGQLDVALIRPGIEDLAFELRAMINGDGSGQASRVGQPLEHRFDSGAGDRGVDFESHTLARTVIDDRKTPQPSTIGQPVGYEVHRPDAVGGRGLWERLALKGADAFTLATPHRKTGFPVQPVRALTVDRPAFAPQQNMDASITIAALHRRDLFDPRTYSAALRSPAAIAVQRARDKYQPARARHTEVPFRHQHGHRFAPRLRAHHFRPCKSFSAAFSSSASASSLFSLLFSASSSLSRRASDTVIPAYFAFQL